VHNSFCSNATIARDKCTNMLFATRSRVRDVFFNWYIIPKRNTLFIMLTATYIDSIVARHSYVQFETAADDR